MKLWSEVGPGMIAFSSARMRACVCVCAQEVHGEGDKDLPAFSAAVTPAGHAGTEEALRRQMLAHTRLHATKVCMPAHAPPLLHIKPSLPSHTHASTPIVAIPCTCFHAHRRTPISALAFTCFHAHCCPPIHTLARLSRSSHKLVSTRIAALAYTRFHAHCALSIHSLSR